MEIITTIIYLTFGIFISYFLGRLISRRLFSGKISALLPSIITYLIIGLLVIVLAKFSETTPLPFSFYLSRLIYWPLNIVGWVFQFLNFIF